MPNSQEHWALDKKIPLAFLLGIAVQTGAMVWWAAALDARVAIIERNDTAQILYGDRITRLESSKEDVARRLDRIETKIDRILETYPPAHPK